MAEEVDPITILIPHYQTLDPIRLCLRSLRYYTPHQPRVVVLDQGSQDESIDYLRSVSWIELWENVTQNDPDVSHFVSLNRGVDDVKTPYFLILHSDAYFRREGWLEFLLDTLKSRQAAAVGSHDQAILRMTLWGRFIHRLRGIRGREVKPGVPKLRSICALYHTRSFRDSRCRFSESHRGDITHTATEQLVKNGHRVHTLSAVVMGRYLFHASGTSRIANQHYFGKNRDKHRTEQENYRRLPSVMKILANDDLDGPSPAAPAGQELHETSMPT